MKNNDFAHPYNDYREPDWQPAHHYPYPDGRHPMHPGYPWNDTEPAANIEPWCPPHPKDDCVCVTEDDVERWNAVTAIGEVKGIDWDFMRSLTGMDIPTSASYWNSCYETVYSNSAEWDKAKNFDTLENNIESLEEEIVQMSASIDDKIGLRQVYTDHTPYKVDGHIYPYYIEGTGVKENPLYLSEHVKQLLYYVETGKTVYTKEQIRAGLPCVPENPPFVTNAEFDDYQKAQKYYDTKITNLESNYNVLGKSVKTIIDLLGAGKDIEEFPHFVKGPVDMTTSKENPDTFYYWSSK